MNLINLFIIILILYVCYKIIFFNHKDTKETFTVTEKINLEGKDIFLGRNLFVGVKQEDVDYYNKLKNKDGSNVLDLSKNNMIIKMNDKNSDFEIKKNICFDNFCVNGKQMELIGGEIDAPNFQKNDKNVYYNHDSETSFSDLPDKMCFKNKDEEAGEPVFTCLNYHDFEILNGERGMKFRSTKSPHYIVEGVSFMEVLEEERNMMNGIAESLNGEDTSGVNKYSEFLNSIYNYVIKLDELNKELRKQFEFKYENNIVKYRIDNFPYKGEISNLITDRISMFYQKENDVVSNASFVEKYLNLIKDDAFIENLEIRIRDDLGEPRNKNYRRIEAEKMRLRDPIKLGFWILYARKYYLGQYPSTGGVARKLKNDYIKELRKKKRKLNSIFNDKFDINGIDGIIAIQEKIKKYSSNDITIFGNTVALTNFMFSFTRDVIVPDGADEKQFIMPYYIDFRKRGSGVANVKDQLFFKENYSCAENNSFYQKNPDFDIQKYPYIQDFDFSEKCADIPREELCQNGDANLDGRFCYKTCCESEETDVGGNPIPKPDWCPAEGSGVMPEIKYKSNKINTDQYPIDVKRSKLGDQRDTSRKHGYFKVSPEFIDPEYVGYYVSKSNNNTRFDTKKNLFTELSRFFGIDINHRASHNGICGKYGSLTKTKNFCDGKNSYDPEFELECNRVSKYRKNLYDAKIEEEEAIAAAAEAAAEGANNNSADITDMVNSITESVETEPVQTTMSVEETLDNLPELNFYIQPAKGDDGNILSSDTYFHAHEHIHTPTPTPTPTLK